MSTRHLFIVKLSNFDEGGNIVDGGKGIRQRKIIGKMTAVFLKIEMGTRRKKMVEEKPEVSSSRFARGISADNKKSFKEKVCRSKKKIAKGNGRE